ncbi:MAG TPA: chloride channel protein [Phycisphaerae bacterium]|jgi:H+/Cl- antiporter ClcA|nr:chloride channel protein [Phycisphaerae bacterium]
MASTPPEDGSHPTVEAASTTEGLPVAPSMAPAMQYVHLGSRPTLMDRRAVLIILLATLLGIASGFIAEFLRWLINVVTNISFFGRFSSLNIMPGEAVPHLGLWVIPIPVIGGIIVGFMARYGSKAIRGHGIPEAMEMVLTNESRILPRVTWLKPLSAAFAIGTGGPFGAEGPIIATGGALGSVIGQVVSTTTDERKTLLAAGAAAGMAATFGSPVSAVLLAVELLLFEFRPRSLIPTAMAAAAATAVRIWLTGNADPVFKMVQNIAVPSAWALTSYIIIGGLIGILATFVTRAVYWFEDGFEHIPVHWMWWPAIGGIVVGVIGYFVPRTLGVGYNNITDTLNTKFTLEVIALLVGAKFLSWAIALGSGTSGGTLAPLFTIGGGVGLLMGAGGSALFPHAGIDPRVAALVGMASIFAGSARAMLASVVFAFETTLQPLGLLPLLGGCAMSYFVSCVLMRNTIMTEKIARRGVRVPAEYAPDYLDMVSVKEAASKDVTALRDNQTIEEVRAFLASRSSQANHQGFPVVGEKGQVIGVVNRRSLLDPAANPTASISSLLRRPPVVVYDDVSLREAADHMLRHDVGRLPVISRAKPGMLVGIITRSDVLAAHRRRLRDAFDPAPPTVSIPFVGRR